MCWEEEAGEEEEGGGEGREWGGGADGAITNVCLPIYTRMRAGRTPGSLTPGVPATWASTSERTEAEKCHIAAVRNPSSDHPGLVGHLIRGPCSSRNV